MKHAIEPNGPAGLHAEGHDVLDLEVDHVADSDAVASPIVADVDCGSFHTEHLAHQRRERGHGSAELPGEDLSQSGKSLVTCVVSGLLMGSFAPFVTRALTSGHPLGPYSIAVFFTVGALLSCFVATSTLCGIRSSVIQSTAAALRGLARPITRSASSADSSGERAVSSTSSRRVSSASPS